jgi:hypothetical protein
MRVIVLADFVAPYMEARCAPNRIVRFFGRDPSGVAPLWAGTGGRKEAFQEASYAVSSCRRIDLGKVCMPKSLVEFDPVWSAL